MQYSSHDASTSHSLWSFGMRWCFVKNGIWGTVCFVVTALLILLLLPHYCCPALPFHLLPLLSHALSTLLVAGPAFTAVFPNHTPLVVHTHTPSHTPSQIALVLILYQLTNILFSVYSIFLLPHNFFLLPLS